MPSLVTNLSSSTVGLQEIVNRVTTADGCVHTADTTQLDFANGKFVQTRRDSPTSCELYTHRRRDSTRQLSRVGVGGVYWAWTYRYGLVLLQAIRYTRGISYHAVAYLDIRKGCFRGIHFRCAFSKVFKIYHNFFHSKYKYKHFSHPKGRPGASRPLKYAHGIRWIGEGIEMIFGKSSVSELQCQFHVACRLQSTNEGNAYTLLTVLFPSLRR